MDPMATDKNQDRSDLPPVPDGHGFVVGDRIEMPLWGGTKICGTVEYIDVTFARKRYKGLAVLGDDDRYYEFHPEIARKL